MKRYFTVILWLILSLKSYGQCTLNVSITASNPAICSGNVVVLTANATSGTPAYGYIWSTGETTPTININKAGTYTVTVSDNTPGCKAVVQTITLANSVTPNAPTSADVTICPNSPATLTASGSPGIYQWYDAPAGGNLLFTGANFTTPLLTSNTTYYVETTVSQCASLRTPVNVNIITTVNVSDVSICQGSVATLTASGASSYQWYDAPSGGNLVSTSPTYTTPVLNSSKTYYVVGGGHGCAVYLTPATVHVTPTPAPPVAQGVTICAGSTANLTVSASDGVIYQWFDVPTGGTALITSPQYTTPVLNAAATYYVEAYVNGCPGPRAAVNVIVNPIPQPPIVNDVTTCAGTNATLSVKFPGGTNQWFSSAVSQTILASGDSFTTPALTATTTYYVQNSNGICSSPRTGVTVNVEPVFPVPMASGQIICPQSGTTLSASATQGTIQWYDAPTGGNLLATGNTFTTPILNATTTYYILATDGICSSTRVPVQVTLLPVTPPPVAPGQTICTPGSVVLVASGPYNVYEWYDAPSGGNLLSKSQALFTPVLSSTTTYYVQTESNGCTSNRTAVTVTVNTTPGTPSASGVTTCQNIPATLTASTVSGIIQWYDAPTGGNPKATGNTFTTPPLIGDTTYYVQSTNGSCTSARIPVTVTVTAVPTPGFGYSSGTYCVSGPNPAPGIVDPSGGTFTVLPAGLVFTDPHTGQINLGASDTGRYTIYFTSNSCPTKSSAKVTLVYEPDAKFSYLPEYCLDAGFASPIFPSGSSAGVFTASPAGLVFATSGSGNIDLAKTLPGTYTVTNTIPQTGSCNTSVYTTNVTIDQVPLVNAGSDQSVVAGTVVQLAGTFSFTAGVTWSGGSGIFSDKSSITSTYTPAPGETNVQLTLTSNDSPAPCGPVLAVVNITILPYPTAPNATGAIICPGNLATLIATTPGGVYQWYDAPAGGNLLATNAVFNTPPLAIATTYYVQATLYGITTPRTPVTVTINNLAQPVAAADSICYNTSATLTASGSTGTYYWYDAAAGGHLLSTSSTFVTPPLTADTAYYVQTIVNQCTSERIRVKITVNPNLLITSAGKVNSCNNTPLNYSITTATPVSLAWSRAAIPNISNPAVNNQTSSIITETLINTGNAPIDVVYIIVPSSNGCTGNPFALTVTVYPNPVVSSAALIKICNNTAPDYTIQFSTPPTSFTWSRSAVGGISNLPVAGQTAATISEVLTNTTKAPIDVHYIFTLTTISCSTSTFDLAVTVNPDYNITSKSTDTVCSGIAQNYVITSSIAPTTYSVSRAAVPNISNPAVVNQSISVIDEPLINTSASPVIVTYMITPFFNGCQPEPFLRYVTVNPQQSTPVAISNSPVCINSTIRLNTANIASATYLWKGPNGFTSTQRNPVISNVTKANAGIYILTLINNNGCTSTADTINVAVDDFPMANAGPNQLVCATNPAVALNGIISGGTTTGVWSTSGTGAFSQATNQLNALYIPSNQDINAGSVVLTLSSTSKDDCNFALSSMTISFQPPPTAYAGPNKDVCSQDVNVPLNGQSTFGSSVLWTSTGTGKFSPSASVASPNYMPSALDIQNGSVFLTFTVNSTLCDPVTSNMTIKFIPPPTVVAGKGIYLEKGKPYMLMPEVNEANIHYLWSPNKYISNDTLKNPIIIGTQDIIYTLTVTDARGCVSQDEITVKELDPLVIPNTFTPNSDGINDLWDIPALNKYPNVTVDIFNRYGQKVYHSNGYGTPWDGLYNGQQLPAGVYYYLINTKYLDEIFSGYVTILR
jgi:gliding motility-associated-like protein